jgi:hypothetical protein
MGVKEKHETEEKGKVRLWYNGKCYGLERDPLSPINLVQPCHNLHFHVNKGRGEKGFRVLTVALQRAPTRPSPCRRLPAAALLGIIVRPGLGPKA